MAFVVTKDLFDDLYQRQGDQYWQQIEYHLTDNDL